MIIRHTNKSKTFDFSCCSDLVYVSKVVRNSYHPETCDCAQIADMLSKEFSNITPVVIKYMIYDGAIQPGGHVVCKINHTDMLLDPTGDYANYTNLSRLKHDIVPWLYIKNDNGIYLSQNHMPVVPSELEKDSEDLLTEWDILRMSAGPFYNGLRGIVI